LVGPRLGAINISLPRDEPNGLWRALAGFGRGVALSLFGCIGPVAQLVRAHA
jgi:hypothetical protein